MDGLHAIQTTRLTLSNRSGSSIYFSEDGCGHAPVIVRAAQAEPSLPPEWEQEDEALFDELGCACWCEELDPEEICSPARCHQSSICGSLGFQTAEIPDGDDVVRDWSGGNRVPDLERKCKRRTGFRPGRVFIAEFFWDGGSQQVEFEYGEPSVTVVVDSPTDSDGDAGSEGS